MPTGGNKVMPAHFLLNTGKGGTRWAVCFCRLWNSWCNNGPGHSRGTATTADCFLSLSRPETLGHPLGQLTVHVHTIIHSSVCVGWGWEERSGKSPGLMTVCFEYVMRRMHRSHWVVSTSPTAGHIDTTGIVHRGNDEYPWPLNGALTLWNCVWRSQTFWVFLL